MKMVLIPLFQLNPLETLFLYNPVSIRFSKQRLSVERSFDKTKTEATQRQHLSKAVKLN